MRVRLSIAVLLTVSACGPIGALTREYYKPPTESKDLALAIVTGFDTGTTGNATPVLAYVGSVDSKLVSLPKPARCNFDKKYRLTVGSHLIGISVSIGPDYTDSLVGYAEVVLPAELGTTYIAKAEFRPKTKAAVWLEDTSTGKDATSRTEIALKDSPQKGIPVGFGLIANACSMP